MDNLYKRCHTLEYVKNVWSQDKSFNADENALQRAFEIGVGFAREYQVITVGDKATDKVERRSKKRGG